MSLWAPPPEPKTALGRYRKLSPLAGVRISPLVLGAMSIGDKWEQFGMGAMNKEQSFKLLDAYYDAGGNCIDTANNYQDESSESFIGEWAEKRGIRDQLVIATKYTTLYKRGRDDIPIKTNFTGNNVKSMRLSVDESLKKLRTHYIDILYVHWWDWNTTVEEVMDGLHNLVVAGKILYLGASDMPAWVVADANRYAKEKGKTPFVVYQGEWSIMQRTLEREILPMCRTLGLALAPWGVLAGGRLRTDADEERRRQTGEKGRTLLSPNWERTTEEKKLCSALEKVGKEVGTEHITAVAIAFIMQKTPYVFPIIGGRKVEQLMANIEALKISLTKEHIKYLESVSPLEPGFPNSYIGDGDGTSPWLSFVGIEDKVPLPQAIRPSAK